MGDEFYEFDFYGLAEVDLFWYFWLVVPENLELGVRFGGWVFDDSDVVEPDEEFLVFEDDGNGRELE